MHWRPRRGGEAAPLAEAWGAVKPLAEAMDEQGWSEDARIRLKATVARIVDTIRLLVRPARLPMRRVPPRRSIFKEDLDRMLQVYADNAEGAERRN